MPLLTGQPSGDPLQALFSGSRGYVLYVLTQFLSNWSQYAVVGGCRCELVNMVVEVSQGSVLSQLMFLL